jgi:signal transduction histidine kinase/ligand-binding sensor domain-containing protein
MGQRDLKAKPAAVDPNRFASSQQVIHQLWTVQQDAPEYILALAQTPDGYLWLGGPTGLFRFDGTHFDRFHSPYGDQLLSTNVHALIAPTTGGLWIGYGFGGFSFLKDGRVTNYGGVIASSMGSVTSFAQGNDGSVWAGTSTGVWRFGGANWNRLGAEWNGPSGSSRVAFDRSGILWVNGPSPSEGKLLYLLPLSKQFAVAKTNVKSPTFLFDSEGRVVESPAEQRVILRSGGSAVRKLQAFPILMEESVQIMDRHNAIWIKPDKDLKMMRIPAPKDLGSLATGPALSHAESYEVFPYFLSWLIDREGSIWFADQRGLHRFFYVSFTPEMSLKGPPAIAPDTDGAVWVGIQESHEPNKLYRITGKSREAVKFPNSRTSQAQAIYVDKRQTVWLGNDFGLWHFVHRKPVQISLPKEVADRTRFLQTFAEDRSGGLWVSFGRNGLYRLSKGQWSSLGGREDLPRSGVVIEFSDASGRVWFGYTKNQLAVLDGDKVHIFGPNNGVHVGNITAINGRGSGIWIGGEFGLQKFAGGRFQSLFAVDDDWLLGISGIIETGNGDLWLNGLSGIFHIGRSEIDEALKNPSYRVRGEHIGRRDGLPGSSAQIRPLPTAIEGSDGRLWFALSSGLVWLDPNRVKQQAMVAPITIQSISQDGHNHPIDSSLMFPAHTSTVEIYYSAISLSDPTAIRTRVRLLGAETNWNEVIATGPITYRNLSPGRYHFNVSASDTNGVWSDKVETIDFAILPAWYQTTWFRVLSGVVSVFLLWSLYQLRLKQLQQQFNVAIDARVSERTRIARELHDTLLQRFNALLLRFQTVSNLLPNKPEEAKRRIDSVVDEGSSAITEGRDAVHELRSAGLMTVDFGQSIRNFSRELFESSSNRQSTTEFQVHVEGAERDLNPVVRDEAYRIAAEAVRNAIRHAGPDRIEVEIRYNEEQLILRIRDDGTGIDSTILNKEHAPGHWGLRGMRERVKLIGGSLEIWSKVGSGTEIELTIPGANAYAKPHTSHRLFFWRS